MKWAKLKHYGPGHSSKKYHAWRDGLAVCANGRKGEIAKAQREAQPYRACLDCLRILGGDPRIIPRYPLAVA